VWFSTAALLTVEALPAPVENSHLISRDIETFQPGVANVRLYDKSGTKVREAAIWFPGSQRVLIYSATATSDGRIIAGGTAEKADGAAAPLSPSLI